MRAAGRSPMPDLGQIRADANWALAQQNLPLCESIRPVADGDTMNPTVIGESSDRRYVVKVVIPQAGEHTADLAEQRRIANAVKERTDLPIPEHLCCVDQPGRLPLMIMEWLPGGQLRLVLVALSLAGMRELCRDWGKCAARFHDPALMDIAKIHSEPAGVAHYWMERTESLFNKHDNSSWYQEHWSAVLTFLEDRLPAMRQFAMHRLTKHAFDVRDFLALAAPSPQISGMLDWEQIQCGDAVCDLVSIWLRLHLMDCADGWKPFLCGYESITGRELGQTPQAEFYLVARTMVATPTFPMACDIIDLALEGRARPFDVSD